MFNRRLLGIHADSLRALASAISMAFLGVSCQSLDTRHHVVISAAEQKMVLLERGEVVATYPVSTSKFGLGDKKNSYRTPIGRMVVAKKIGDNTPKGAVFKSRHWTGEVLPPDAPGRDPILTRILWLKGREFSNRNAFGRHIYIHGTTEERKIGKPASYGCVRMRSRDVLDLYEKVRIGTPVTILRGRMPMAVQTASFRKGVRQATAQVASNFNRLHKSKAEQSPNAGPPSGKTKNSVTPPTPDVPTTPASRQVEKPASRS